MYLWDESHTQGSKKEIFEVKEKLDGRSGRGRSWNYGRFVKDHGGLTTVFLRLFISETERNQKSSVLVMALK